MRYILLSILFCVFVMYLNNNKWHIVHDTPVVIEHDNIEYNVTCGYWRDQYDHCIEQYLQLRKGITFETCSLYQRLFRKCITLQGG